jgi:hypothetical protein
MLLKTGKIIATKRSGF